MLPGHEAPRPLTALALPGLSLKDRGTYGSIFSMSSSLKAVTPSREVRRDSFRGSGFDHKSTPNQVLQPVGWCRSHAQPAVALALGLTDPASTPQSRERVAPQSKGCWANTLHSPRATPHPRAPSFPVHPLSQCRTFVIRASARTKDPRELVCLFHHVGAQRKDDHL